MNQHEENEVRQEINFEDFLKVDIRVGTIIEVSLNSKAKKESYILKIDFGTNLGIKKSSAQIVTNYTREELFKTQVLAVINFPPKRVAGVKSEVLVLAVVNKNKGTILIRPSQQCENGSRVL